MRQNVKKILAIRVDGNRHIGLGHIFRCLHFASRLKVKTGTISEFFIQESSCVPYVLELMGKKQFHYSIVSNRNNPWQEDLSLFINSLNERHGAVLVDQLLPDATDADLNNNGEYIPADVEHNLKELSKLDLPLFAFSDQFDRMNINADLIINTCPTQKPDWYQNVNGCKYLLGHDYYILDYSFMKLKTRIKRFRTTKPRIVVFCGGNDHRGFTVSIVRTLKTLSYPVDIEAIVGSATPDSTEIVRRLRSEGIKTYFEISDIAQVLFNGDLLITTAGNTLFDVTAIGLPAIVFSTRERQRVTARFFSSRGSCIDIGEIDNDIWKRLKKYSEEIIPDKERLEEMSSKGRSLIDGLGADRIIKEINSRMC